MQYSIKKLSIATANSWKGLVYAWKSQWAIRFEVVLLILALPSALFLATGLVEFILLFGSVLLLIIIELLNTAVETTVNRIGLEYNELSGLAKDLGSSAIFVSIVYMLMVWGLLFFHRIW